MLIYNTQREMDEMERIKSLVRNVINPNTDIPKSNDMKPYLAAVRNSYGVICSEIDGHIGKGVFSEIAQALAEGKKTFVLRGKILIPIRGLRVVNDKDWKLSYGKVIT